MQCANLGDIRSNHEPTVTYEGDNNVLSQQTGNWLLRQYETALSGNTVDSPLGTLAFLNDCRAIMAQKFSCSSTAELKSRECEFEPYSYGCKVDIGLDIR